MDRWTNGKTGAPQSTEGVGVLLPAVPRSLPTQPGLQAMPTLSHRCSSAVVTKPRVSGVIVAWAHTSWVSASERVLFRSSGAI